MNKKLDREEFIAELEDIIESDEAYGGNIQILIYSFKNETVTGKFKDSWNNRVYEFSIDIDGVNYKPAIKLDSVENVLVVDKRLDSYSKGYLSLFVNREDKLRAGKRTKKPKCGNSAYGCGYSCIGLVKTCRILSSGKKAGLNKGSAISKERLTKLLKRGSELDNAIKENIISARKQHKEEGTDRILSRQAMKDFGFAPERGNQTKANSSNQKVTTSQSTTKEITQKATSQGKQGELSLNRSETSERMLSNKEFSIVNDTEVREKISQWTDSFEQIEKQLNNNKNIDDIKLERLNAATTAVGALIDLQSEKDVVFGGVVDRNGKLQAAYAYSETSGGYYVDYLASAPWNSLSDHPDKKAGAGTSAIEGLVKDAISKNKKGEIELTALPDAVPFYEKVGFIVTYDSEFPDMKLNEKNAKKFISQQDKKNRKDTTLEIDDLKELEILEEQALGLFTVPLKYLNQLTKK